MVITICVVVFVFVVKNIRALFMVYVFFCSVVAFFVVIYILCY